MSFLGLNREETGHVADELNNLLANLHVHYQKLRNFHWNVKGPHFFELHRQFEDLYNVAKLRIDEVTERILSLNHYPTSTLKEYLDKSDIREAVGSLSGEEMIKEILSDYQILLKNMRNLIDIASEAGDEGTASLISDYLDDLEKKGWMFNAYLGNRSGKGNEQKSAAVAEQQ